MLNSLKFARLFKIQTLAGAITYQKSRYLSKLLCNPNVNTFTERSHNCGQLSRDDIGKRVNLYGWVKYSRFDNKIIALRDSYGTVQCIMDKSQLTKSFRKTAIHNESVVRVEGIVKARPADRRKESQALGDIEVLVDDMEIITAARGDIPILARGPDCGHSLEVRLKYRYLDIRGENLQEALRFRSKVCQIFRNSLQDLGFVECETPTLFRRTPGGANEFIVPTQMAGLFYGLTQSPQQLKQLLMIGGLDRYFQICRCYRDESSRSDRQPEFTQLDIELSFTSQEHIMNMIEQLISDLFRKLSQVTDLSLELGSIKRMSYQEAFKKYGTDKPDTRFGWLLEEVGNNDICFTIPQLVSHELVADSLAELRDSGNMNTSGYEVTASSSNGSTVILVRSRTLEARKIMGHLRLKLAEQLQQEGGQIYQRGFKFLWVTDFPLFVKKDDGSEALSSNHHPFTAPTEGTAQYLTSDPLKVIGQHYDLVLNGQEIAGGSIRIHRPELQRFVFNDILKLDEKTFDYFTEALSSGCPPHGGIALGLDRFIAILLNKDSIRDVIAFPKSTSGRDSMSNCPHKIDASTQNMYHIKVPVEQ